MKNDEKENDIKKGYDEEEKFLLIKRKEKLGPKLKDILKNLENKNDINTFLEVMVKEVNQLSREEIYREKNISRVRFIIKVLGPIFVVLHLIGIFQMNGMMNAVKEEIFKSVKLFLIKPKKLIKN